MVFVFNSRDWWRGIQVTLAPSITFVCFLPSAKLHPCFFSQRFSSPTVTAES